jgi:hypothetical protein
MLIEHGLGASAPDSLPEFETQTVPPPHEADVASAEQVDEEMAREEPSAREVVAVAQEEASAIGGEVAGAVSTDVVLEEVPAPLALAGVADPDDSGRASSSLAQIGELPWTRGTQLR